MQLIYQSWSGNFDIYNKGSLAITLKNNGKPVNIMTFVVDFFYAKAGGCKV
jgi:hypothetical protein